MSMPLRTRSRCMQLIECSPLLCEFNHHETRILFLICKGFWNKTNLTLVDVFVLHVCIQGHRTARLFNSELHFKSILTFYWKCNPIKIAFRHAHVTSVTRVCLFLAPVVVQWCEIYQFLYVVCCEKRQPSWRIQGVWLNYKSCEVHRKVLSAFIPPTLHPLNFQNHFSDPLASTEARSLSSARRWWTHLWH